MTVLGTVVLLLVAAIIVAVSWDAFLRGKRGKGRYLGAAALAACIAAGVLQANEAHPWFLTEYYERAGNDLDTLLADTARVRQRHARPSRVG